MRKIILGLAMFFSFSAICQIKVVEEKPTIKIGKVGSFLFMDKTEDIYTVIYQDIKYSQLSEYKSFSFKDQDEAFENLYKIIINGFDTLPKEDIKLELPEDIVWLHYTKTMGIVSLQFTSSKKNGDLMGVSSYMTKKQLNKLFGKI